MDGLDFTGGGTRRGHRLFLFRDGGFDETHFAISRSCRRHAFRIRLLLAGIGELQLLEATERHLLVHLCR